MSKIDELLEAFRSLNPQEKREFIRRLQGEIEGEPGVNLFLFGEDFTAVDTAWEGEADYVILFDGGSEGNPGPGYGSYVLLTKDGRRRIRRFEYGKVTSNEAEYETLIRALSELISTIEESGKSPAEFTVEIRGDSALVVNQVLGSWKAREPRMKLKRNEVRRLLGRFKNYRLIKVPRSEVSELLGH